MINTCAMSALQNFPEFLGMFLYPFPWRCVPGQALPGSRLEMHCLRLHQPHFCIWTKFPANDVLRSTDWNHLSFIGVIGDSIGVCWVKKHGSDHFFFKTTLFDSNQVSKFNFSLKEEKKKEFFFFFSPFSRGGLWGNCYSNCLPKSRYLLLTLQNSVDCRVAPA